MTDQPQMFTCACCGEQYARGQFTCCKPPRGMSIARWLELHCAVCGTHEADKKCPKHCTCAKPVTEVHGWHQANGRDAA